MDQKSKIIITKVPKKNKILMWVLFSKFLLVLPPFRWYVRKHLTYCSHIHFVPGIRFFYGNIYAHHVHLNDTFFLDYAPIYIGEHTKFSFDNMVITGTHELKNRDIVTARPVRIGKNVWISSRSVILGGVTIGDNSVIGAGSVVTRNIPPNCVAAGNPARVIKRLQYKSKKNKTDLYGTQQ